MLIDPESLGPNAIAIETAATMVGVSADDVSTFSCALMHAAAAAKQTTSRTIFDGVAADSSVRRPKVQDKQNRVCLLSQRASMADVLCSHALKIEGCRRLSCGAGFAAMLQSMHTKDGRITVDAIFGGAPFADGKGGELCVGAPHFDMKEVCGNSTTQGRATLLGHAVDPTEEHGINFYNRSLRGGQMNDSEAERHCIFSVRQRGTLRGVAMPPDGFCGGTAKKPHATRRIPGGSAGFVKYVFTVFAHDDPIINDLGWVRRLERCTLRLETDEARYADGAHLLPHPAPSQPSQPSQPSPPSPLLARRCQFAGCLKGARGATGLCSSHGGGKQCQFAGCLKGALGATGLCISHGGGKRCQFAGCLKGARGATGLCISHGGGKRSTGGTTGSASPS